MTESVMKASWSKCQYLFILLLHFTTVSTQVKFEVLGPAGPVVAVAGEDVVLPCYLKPNISAVDLRVEWFRVQINNPIVHLYQERKDINENQIPSYRGRTSLFPDELKKGNTSLKLRNARGSDNGEYKCFVQSPGWFYDSSIHINIKAVGTQPVISIEGYKDCGINLLCESKGWYPEPEVVWMDSEGHTLPAGPTETNTDLMDLFTVRQQVTVQERDTNRFTCRVLLHENNEMKETTEDIPDEFFRRAHPWKETLAVIFSLAAVSVIGNLILLHRFVKLQRNKAITSKKDPRPRAEYNLQNPEVAEMLSHPPSYSHGEFFHRAHLWKVTLAMISLAAVALIGDLILLFQLRRKKDELKIQLDELKIQLDEQKIQLGEFFHCVHPWSVALAVISSLAAVAVIGGLILLFQLWRKKDEQKIQLGEFFHRAHPWKVALAVIASLATVGVVGGLILLFQLRRKKEFMRAQRAAVDVTLDPKTANPNLILTGDGEQVRC